MGIIFYLSSRPGIDITDIYLIDFLIFKTLHVIEYGLLYFLLFRALYGHRKYGMGQAFFLALTIGVLYAASDEVHQTFVPNREGRLRDVVIDFIGMSLMYIYIKSHLAQIKKYLV